MAGPQPHDSRARIVAYLRSRLLEDARGGPDGWDSLAARIETMLEQGRARWPAVELDEVAFVEHLLRVGEPGGLESEPPFEGMFAAELYLACACASGNAQAHRDLDRHYLADARRMVAGLVPASEVDGVVQQVRERVLLPGADQPARIATYSGAGKLRNWVRIVARRIAATQRAAPAASADPSELAASMHDPEVSVIKQALCHDYRHAIACAFEGLQPRQRTLLRLRYVDGLPVQAIANVVQLHRVSVSRALASARAALLDGLRQALADRLRLSPSEIDSVLRLVASQADLHLSRALSD